MFLAIYQIQSKHSRLVIQKKKKKKRKKKSCPLVSILSTLEGWKADSILKPPSGFEPNTPWLGIQHFNYYTIASTLYP